MEATIRQLVAVENYTTDINITERATLGWMNCDAPHTLAIGLHKRMASPTSIIFLNNFGYQLPRFEQAYTTRACKVPSLLWYSISTGTVVFSDNLSCALLGIINVHITTLPEGPF